ARGRGAVRAALRRRDHGGGRRRAPECAGVRGAVRAHRCRAGRRAGADAAGRTAGRGVLHQLAGGWMSAAREFTVLSREWCHLCHDLVAALEPIAAELGWSVRVLDVDADPALEARWDELVPVVLAGE